jgi:hypothetical protein
MSIDKKEQAIQASREMGLLKCTMYVIENLKDQASKLAVMSLALEFITSRQESLFDIPAMSRAAFDKRIVDASRGRGLINMEFDMEHRKQYPPLYKETLTTGE